MRERPILFSGPMVRAILEGRKTQTRRVMKPQPINRDEPDHAFEFEFVEADGWWRTHIATGSSVDQWNCPFGQPGDRLWVRETFCEAWVEPAGEHGRFEGYHYRATTPDVVHVDDHERSPWKPSIHMPREASRITLEVTGVRVERLQEITTEDILAEGLATTLREHDAEVDLRQQWQAGWDGLNAARGHGWDTNPWVWVVEFKRLEVAGV